MRQELLPKANATCKICGNPYYVCKRCIELRDKDIYVWKLDCDTPQCFQILTAANEYKNNTITKSQAKEIIAEAQKYSDVTDYIAPYAEIVAEIQAKEKVEIEKPIQVSQPTTQYTQIQNNNKKNKSGKRYGKY